MKRESSVTMESIPARNSNLELLRIICIYGIVTMHTFGIFYNDIKGANLVYGVIINSLFNMGVSIFALISGWFGIKESLYKIFKLEILILFYSVMSVIIDSIEGGISVKSILLAFLPVYSQKYWYITAYMLLLCFGKYINKVPKQLNQLQFKEFIFFMILIFSIIPTFIMKDTMGSGGKDVIIILMLYWIGRYIRLYINKENYTIWIKRGICLSIIGLAGNMGLSFLMGGTRVIAPFARDCSLTIMAGSIGVFLFFIGMKPHYSKIINQIAKHVVAVYLFERAVRVVLSKRIDLMQYSEKWYLFAVIGGYVFVVLVICILTDVCIDIILGNIINFVADKLVVFGKKLMERNDVCKVIKM